MDIVKYNSMAWDKCAERKEKWSVPVSKHEIENAANGELNVVLTPSAKVPKSWFPPMHNLRVLGLASGGGQQIPLFAAAGAHVTCFDNSEQQLLLDKKVCDENNLELRIEQGDMRDLSRFADASFDLVFNPCSIAFVPDIKPVWKEVYRVLAKGGIFMTGFYNPVTLLFNEKDVEDDNLILKYKMPYSDTESLSQNELQKFIDNAEPLIHGHSLNEIMGEQMRLGFQFTDMFEDTWDNNNNLNKHFPCFIATRAVK